MFALWQREDLQQARLFQSTYEDVTLLGGWFHAEVYPSRTQRWTGPVAELYCPPELSGLTISGFVEKRTKISVERAGRILYSSHVSGDFEIEIVLREVGGGILSLEVEPARQPVGDPRRLGICVTKIVARGTTGTVEVSLTKDFQAWMRSRDPQRWVESLIEITNARTMSDDAMFLSARGPHSSSLTAWLDSNIARYDVVLGHGVPFTTSVTAVKHATLSGIPCVVLPHYHMEDKYYHWRHYYRAFQEADLVIAAPPTSKTMFFDKVGAKSVALPGGGIDPSEFENLGPSAQAFRLLHASKDPFVLVLGRKSGAKNYSTVIEAVDLVNRNGKRLDLVMIGPDADGRAIESRHVMYYGAQPRTVVLGALASCIGLVNMSDSESFGIVVVEAFACRKPVIANRRCVALADLVTPGLNGFLCGAVAELAVALERLIDHPEEAEKLGLAGYRKVVETYTWPAIAASIDNLLMSQCAARAPDPKAQVAWEVS